MCNTLVQCTVVWIVALFLSFYFRRAFQLLSAGLFLPGSLGIIDPCEVNVIVICLLCTWMYAFSSPNCTNLTSTMYVQQYCIVQVCSDCFTRDTSLSDVLYTFEWCFFFHLTALTHFPFPCYSQEMCVPTVF